MPSFGFLDCVAEFEFMPVYSEIIFFLAFLRDWTKFRMCCVFIVQFCADVALSRILQVLAETSLLLS